MNAMKTTKAICLVAGLGLSWACGGVASEDDARLASLGLDAIVSRALALGFDGFNAADSANIPPQNADGAVSGAIVVGGQVDQGASANKGMRLEVTLVDHAEVLVDDPLTDAVEALELRFSTKDDSPLAVDLSLKGIPDGTLTGSVLGTALIEGDLEAEVDVELTLSGAIESDGEAGTTRTEGSTLVEGVVSSANGDFDVDFDI